MIPWALLFMLMVLAGITQPGHTETSKKETSIEKVKEEAKNFIKALKDYTAEQQDDAIGKAKDALDNMDERLDALEKLIDEKWDEMDKTAREKARANLKALRKKRTQVAERYGSLKNSSSAAWEHMKQGFSEAYEALYDAWEKSASEY